MKNMASGHFRSERPCLTLMNIHGELPLREHGDEEGFAPFHTRIVVLAPFSCLRSLLMLRFSRPLGGRPHAKLYARISEIRLQEANLREVPMSLTRLLQQPLYGLYSSDEHGGGLMALGDI